jgi:hypothetical protein
LPEILAAERPKQIALSFGMGTWVIATVWEFRRVVTQPVGLGYANGRAFGPEEGNKDA